MGETDKIVALDFVVGGDALESAEKIGKATKEIGGHLKEAQSQAREFGRTFIELAASVGLGIGLGEIVKGFVESNSQMEMMQRRLGSLTAAYYEYSRAGKSFSPAENMAQGMVVAREQLEEFQKLSMKTGIKTESYEGISAALMPAFSGAGKGSEEVVKATQKLAIIASKTGQDPEDFAHRIALAIETGQARGLRGYGIGGKSFAGESPEKRVQDVEKALSKFNVTGQESATTLTGMFQTVKSDLEYIEEIAGKELFAAAKVEVKEFTEWIGKNKEEIIATAKVVTVDLVDGLHDLVAGAKFLADHMAAVKGTVEVIAAIWGANKLFKMTEGGIGLGGDLMGKVKSILPGAGAEAGAALGKAARASLIIDAGLIGVAVGTWIGNEIMKVVPGSHQNSEAVNARNERRQKSIIDRDYQSMDFLLSEKHRGGKSEQDVINGLLSEMSHTKDQQAALTDQAKGNIGKEELKQYLADRGKSGLMGEQSVSERTKGGLTQNITNHNNFNFDKDHDADEMAFSIQDIFRKIAENPKQVGHVGQHSFGT